MSRASNLANYYGAYIENLESYDRDSPSIGVAAGTTGTLTQLMKAATCEHKITI